MDKRISIESRSRVSDNSGGFSEVWDSYLLSWASISPLSASEKWRAQQMETAISHKIIMKYQSGITTANRIVWSGRVFNITEVLNIDESDVVLELMATEGTAT